jgi:hypothetical protein
VHARNEQTRVNDTASLPKQWFVKKGQFMPGKSRLAAPAIAATY